MADCSGEKPPPVWCLPPPDLPADPPAETFVAKLTSLLFGTDQDRRKKKCYKKKPTYQYGCCFSVIFAVFFLSTICCAIMWFTDIYLDSILNQMTLKEGTEIFEAWRKPPVKPLICVHAFNYTNMDDYSAGRSSKIHVNETGPYCYRETLEKIDIKFYDNGTVSYGDRRTHVFEPKNSTGSINDTLVVPNLPLISAIAMSRDLPGLVQLTLGGMLWGLDMTSMITVPAHEFLFGYNDTFMSIVKGFSKFIHQEMPFEKFGILAMRAAVTKDRLTITTGSEDLDEIGVVTALNGEAKLTAWDDDQCNRLDGSDGAFFPRHHINQTAKLYLFHKDLCRKLPLVFEKEVDFQDGVMGMRFHTPPDVYNTTGSCYCKHNSCPPVGVFDVSPCAVETVKGSSAAAWSSTFLDCDVAIFTRHGVLQETTIAQLIIVAGAPIMMSFPHFMNAEPSVSAHLEGLHPNPKRHDFFIDIQPILGFTLGTVSRIQLNIQIRKSRQISMLKEFDDGTILPVVWFEVTADRLPPDLFKMIYHASVTVQWIQWSLQWGLLAISVLSAACLLLCPCLRQPVQTQSLPTREVIIVKLSSV